MKSSHDVFSPRRQQSSGKQVFEEKTESCSEDNVDKACLSVSRSIPVSEDAEATDKIEAEVKEISLEAEGSSLDIPVVTPPDVDNVNRDSSLP